MAEEITTPAGGLATRHSPFSRTSMNGKVYSDIGAVGVYEPEASNSPCCSARTTTSAPSRWTLTVGSCASTTTPAPSAQVTAAALAR